MKRLLLMILSPLAVLASPASAGTIIVDGRFDGQFGTSSFTDTKAVFTGDYIDDSEELIDGIATVKLRSLTAGLTVGGVIVRFGFTDSALLAGLISDTQGLPVIALFGTMKDVLFAYRPVFADGEVITPTDDSGMPIAAPAFAVATATGTGTLRITGGTGSSTTITPGDVAAVPEPATWAMMIVGFGLIGGAMRYRRRGVRITLA